MEEKWLNESIKALNSLGGKGSLEEIYKMVEERTEIDLTSYTDWKSRIRVTIYRHSSDCDIFNGNTGDTNDLFYSIDGKGKGYWGLRNDK